jgi:hypothetical protein
MDFGRIDPGVLDEGHKEQRDAQATIGRTRLLVALSCGGHSIDEFEKRALQKNGRVYRCLLENACTNRIIGHIGECYKRTEIKPGSDKVRCRCVEAPEGMTLRSLLDPVDTPHDEDGAAVLVIAMKQTIEWIFSRVAHEAEVELGIIDHGVSASVHRIRRYVLKQGGEDEDPLPGPSLDSTMMWTKYRKLFINTVVENTIVHVLGAIADTEAFQGGYDSVLSLIASMIKTTREAYTGLIRRRKQESISRHLDNVVVRLDYTNFDLSRPVRTEDLSESEYNEDSAAVLGDDENTRENNVRAYNASTILRFWGTHCSECTRGAKRGSSRPASYDDDGDGDGDGDVDASSQETRACETLGLQYTNGQKPTVDEIKEKLREFQLKYHPDRNHATDKAETARRQEIFKAKHAKMRQAANVLYPDVFTSTTFGTTEAEACATLGLRYINGQKPPIEDVFRKLDLKRLWRIARQDRDRFAELKKKMGEAARVLYPGTFDANLLDRLLERQTQEQQQQKERQRQEQQQRQKERAQERRDARSKKARLPRRGEHDRLIGVLRSKVGSGDQNDAWLSALIGLIETIFELCEVVKKCAAAIRESDIKERNERIKNPGSKRTNKTGERSECAQSEIANGLIVKAMRHIVSLLKSCGASFETVGTDETDEADEAVGAVRAIGAFGAVEAAGIRMEIPRDDQGLVAKLVDTIKAVLTTNVSNKLTGLSLRDQTGDARKSKVDELVRGALVSIVRGKPVDPVVKEHLAAKKPRDVLERALALLLSSTSQAKYTSSRGKKRQAIDDAEQCTVKSTGAESLVVCAKCTVRREIAKLRALFALGRYDVLALGAGALGAADVEKSKAKETLESIESTYLDKDGLGIVHYVQTEVIMWMRAMENTPAESICMCQSQCQGDRCTKWSKMWAEERDRWVSDSALKSVEAITDLREKTEKAQMDVKKNLVVDFLKKWRVITGKPEVSEEPLTRAAEKRKSRERKKKEPKTKEQEKEEQERKNEERRKKKEEKHRKSEELKKDKERAKEEEDERAKKEEKKSAFVRLHEACHDARRYAYVFCRMATRGKVFRSDEYEYDYHAVMEILKRDGPVTQKEMKNLGEFFRHVKEKKKPDEKPDEPKKPDESLSLLSADNKDLLAEGKWENEGLAEELDLLAGNTTNTTKNVDKFNLVRDLVREVVRNQGVDVDFENDVEILILDILTSLDAYLDNRHEYIHRVGFLGSNEEDHVIKKMVSAAAFVGCFTEDQLGKTLHVSLKSLWVVARFPGAASGRIKHSNVTTASFMLVRMNPAFLLSSRFYDKADVTRITENAIAHVTDDTNEELIKRVDEQDRLRFKKKHHEKQIYDQADTVSKDYNTMNEAERLAEMERRSRVKKGVKFVPNPANRQPRLVAEILFHMVRSPGEFHALRDTIKEKARASCDALFRSLSDRRDLRQDMQVAMWVVAERNTTVRPKASFYFYWCLKGDDRLDDDYEWDTDDRVRNEEEKLDTMTVQSRIMDARRIARAFGTKEMHTAALEYLASVRFDDQLLRDIMPNGERNIPVDVTKYGILEHTKFSSEDFKNASTELEYFDLYYENPVIMVLVDRPGMPAVLYDRDKVHAWVDHEAQVTKEKHESHIDKLLHGQAYEFATYLNHVREPNEMHTEKSVRSFVYASTKGDLSSMSMSDVYKRMRDVYLQVIEKAETHNVKNEGRKVRLCPLVTNDLRVRSCTPKMTVLAIQDAFYRYRTGRDGKVRKVRLEYTLHLGTNEDEDEKIYTSLIKDAVVDKKHTDMIKDCHAKGNEPASAEIREPSKAPGATAKASNNKINDREKGAEAQRKRNIELRAGVDRSVAELQKKIEEERAKKQLEEEAKKKAASAVHARNKSYEDDDTINPEDLRRRMEEDAEAAKAAEADEAAEPSRREPASTSSVFVSGNKGGEIRIGQQSERPNETVGTAETGGMETFNLDQYMTENPDDNFLLDSEDDMLDGLMFDGEAAKAAEAAEADGPSRGEQEITGRSGEIGSPSEDSIDKIMMDWQAGYEEANGFGVQSRWRKWI